MINKGWHISSHQFDCQCVHFCSACWVLLVVNYFFYVNGSLYPLSGWHWCLLCIDMLSKSGFSRKANKSTAVEINRLDVAKLFFIWRVKIQSFSSRRWLTRGFPCFWLLQSCFAFEVWKQPTSEWKGRFSLYSG